MRRLLCLICCLLPLHTAAANNLLVFGDSLSAGYGLGSGQDWPALLSARLKSKGLDYSVVNASVSGETSAGGLSRLPKILRRVQPTMTIIALGANDGLRGLPLAALRANLSAMVTATRKAHSLVLLVGMKLPPNLGVQYATQFAAVYRQVAAQQKVSLLPFLLEPIALDAAAFQPDGLHPTAAAQPKILDHVWLKLNPLLQVSAK